MDGKYPFLLCTTCGVGYSIEEITDLIPGSCKPLGNIDDRIPMGKTPDGWVDCFGVSFTEEEFLENKKVDPELYLNWRNKGRKKYI